MPIEVVFKPVTWHKNDPAEQERIKMLVQNYAEMPAGTTRAVIVSGWHKSAKDQRKHVTVDFFDDNRGIKFPREHVVDPDELLDTLSPASPGYGSSG